MSQDRHPVEEVLAECVERLRRGEEVSVEDYAARHPELADQLPELIEAAVALERLKIDKQSVSGGRLVGAIEGEFGDFDVIREIGRGGMGVVYEAEQRALGRRVALKILPRHSLPDAARVERFGQEARMAAQLHHTNIVPVFGFGEHDGHHYYVMQCIRGVGLDLVLTRLLAGESATAQSAVAHSDLQPDAAAQAMRDGRFVSDAESATGLESYWLSVADLGRQVAGALDYAHSRGTLHRDIKPANLLLDADGVVWITDFGLARAIAEDPLTRTGEIVGTVRYMAPEQLHGEGDARSDVYGLGLTLYELATRRPAFDDRTGQGLVDKVRTRQPVRPRRVDPAIPVDLETIILKATAVEPADRYASAAALEADLRLFSQDRPIGARRASALEHAWRWCRRNKMVAGLAATALLAVLVASVVGWVAYGVTNAALGDTRSAIRQAEDNLELGVRALEDIFDQVAGFESIADEDESTGGAEDLRIVSPREAELLQSLLAFYDEFARRNAQNRDTVADAAFAYHRVGQIHVGLGSHAAAERAFRHALTRYEALSLTPTLAVARAAVHNDLGKCLQRRSRRRGPRGQSPASTLHHEKAAELLLDLDAADARFEFARTLDLLGSSGPVGPRRGRARGYRERALALRTKLLAESPQNPAYREAVARSRARVASTLRRSDPDGAQEHLDAAVTTLVELRREFPQKPRYGYALIEAWSEGVRGRRRRVGDAQRIAKAWEVARELVEAHPESPLLVQTMLEMLFRLHPPELRGFERGKLRSVIARGYRGGGAKIALRRYEQSCRLLVGWRTGDASLRVWIVVARLQLAELYFEHGDADRARATIAASRRALVGTGDPGPEADAALLAAHDALRRR